MSREYRLDETDKSMIEKPFLSKNSGSAYIPTLSIKNKSDKNVGERARDAATSATKALLDLQLQNEGHKLDGS